MLHLYLAGAIRDGKAEDIEWREEVAQKLFPYVESGLLRILSPLGGKVYNEQERVWTISGVRSNAHLIVSQDFWCVDRADICVFNFLPLTTDYKSIGTLSEWGRSTARSCLRFVIWPSDFTGHENQMYKQVHPFIANNATQVFASVEECASFLLKHVPVVAGVAPGYDPDGAKQDYMYDRLLKNLPNNMKGQA